MSHTPTPHTFLTHLLSPPIKPSPISTSAPLDHPSSLTADPTLSPLPTSLKPLLTTLHALYPTELLPALDLLDRRLVTRHTYRPPRPPHPPLPENPSSTETNPPSPSITYHVRSSRPARGSHHRRRTSHHDAPPDDDGPSYEVRTRAWNCSCAAFAFAAFGAGAAVAGGRDGGHEGEEGDDGWVFGGLGLELEGGRAPPVCKHLMACVLAERLAAWVGGVVRDVEVGQGEMGGWAAGWGG
ncbi:MAG: hypothetical protein M1833_000228 [Piccolia ochrophora]|nr:MAG: hypothetical protein M1833_000228 [Piccolia ochrophora]